MSYDMPWGGSGWHAERTIYTPSPNLSHDDEPIAGRLRFTGILARVFGGRSLNRDSRRVNVYSMDSGYEGREDGVA